MLHANKFWLSILIALPAMCQEQFSWKDLGDGRIELREGSKSALVYNYGVQHGRCCYIFPVYTPAGVSMLDDSPKDHPHHRGLFSAWPIVETGDKKYDLWMKLTAKPRSAKTPVTSAHTNEAKLEAENLWQADERDIVKENLRLRVLPSQNGAREIEVALTFEALGAPVTLRGSPDKGKSYGGFSARFAQREETIIRADGELVSKDEDLVPHQWAELEGVYGGKRAVLRITTDSKNPGAPYQWCLRKYGFVGASFPGRTATVDGYTLEPGKPLTLKFTVRVSDR